MMCAVHTHFRASWSARWGNVLILACGFCYLRFSKDARVSDVRSLPHSFQRRRPSTTPA